MMASVPSIAIWDFESFRSKRVPTSFVACWMALATSARSILLTISKLLSGMECPRQSLGRNNNGFLNLRIVMPSDARPKLRAPRIARPQLCLSESNRRSIVRAGPLCARFRFSSFPHQAKELVKILCRLGADLVGWQGAEFADLARYFPYKRRFVALSAMRNRRQVR